ncbi:MAG: primosomal protein N' [Oscillospiraceae bacterium]
MPVTANIVLENASPSFDNIYSYLVPDSLSVSPGSRVRIPFGRADRVQTGLVLALGEAESTDKLKPVLQVLDEEPLLTDEGLRLLHYLREQTFCTWYDALRLLIPTGLGISGRLVYRMGDIPGESLSETQQRILAFVSTRRKSAEETALCKAADIQPGDSELEQLVQTGVLVREEELRQKVLDDRIGMVRPVEDAPTSRLTDRQREVLDFLWENGEVSLREACYFTGASRGVFDKLRKVGAVEFYEVHRPRGGYAQAEPDDAPPPPLSPAQEKVCTALLEQMQSEMPPLPPALLYGVTGSGKTQVFLHLIAETVAAGKGVIVMVPEISLTSQTVRSLQGRFGGRVAVLHSGLSLGERMDEWKRIKEGKADIVVGTRSAVFAPLPTLGLIVMDEEQEHTYNSDRSPRYHARDVAKVRCAWQGAQLLLCSATPSVESYHAAKEGRYRLFSLHERFGDAVLPEVTVVDMKEPDSLSISPSFSNLLLEELRYNLERGEQAILLLNRRGYSTVVKCADCGEAAECPQCSVAMTYHAANDSLICHYCGHIQPRSAACPHCGSELIRYAGAGTQKLEEELGGIFPDARILRMDMDTTMSRYAHERMFGAFLAGEYDIMIGTQMVAKGLNFPNVTLVGVLNADQSLYSDDFRSYERSFSLLTQVVGRSGRGTRPGRAFIQTWSPDHPIIQLATAQDYPGFFRQEILGRKLHLYPPFCALAGVGFVGEDHLQVREWSNRFVTHFRELASAEYAGLPIRLLGPAPGEVLRVAGKYRYKLIIKCRNDKGTRELLSRMLEWFYKECRSVSAFVDMYYDRL